MHWTNLGRTKQDGTKIPDPITCWRVCNRVDHIKILRFVCKRVRGMNQVEIKSSEHVKILGVTTERIKMEWIAPKSKRDERQIKKAEKGVGESSIK